jgi:DNA-binding PadR family transcriptional regulator
MRGDVVFGILEALAGAAQGLVDIVEVILSAGYGASYGKLQKGLKEKERERAGRDLERRAKQRYYVMLSKLRAQGFIEIKRIKEKKVFFITKKGREKFRFMEKHRKEKLPHISSPAEKSNTFIIVAFDIPEKEKKKREWLRRVLKQLELQMIQRSVWIGRVRLPEEFLAALNNLHLIECVEIFEVNKTGTLKHIV